MASGTAQPTFETGVATEANLQAETATEVTAQTGTATEAENLAVDPGRSEIAKIAYQLWLDRGCPHGSDQEDWFRAEKMLKANV